MDSYSWECGLILEAFISIFILKHHQSETITNYYQHG
jgi:hypothetical protein